MPRRNSDFDEKFLYTETNPENIIAGKKGSYFFRGGLNFYVNLTGDIEDRWEQLQYRTVILPAPDSDRAIQYEHPNELWIKTTDGFLDDERQVKPKTGWKFYSYRDVFLGAQPRDLNWCFPVPSSSYDPTGNANCRSYDENFFYAKTGSLWFRTPIAIFTLSGPDIGEQPSLYNNLPFVVAPRKLPVPANSNNPNSVQVGDQTYDRDFFYIRVSKWKRSPLIVYNPFALTLF